MKKWGRLKIERQLKQLGLSPYCISKGLSEIEEEDYLQTITDLAEKKNQSIDEQNTLVRRNKIEKYLASKGFEYHLIGKCISDLI